MFGHCDAPAHWAAHLAALRALQRRTGGITEFVPLPFVHMEAPLFLKGRSRRGPTLRECTLLHAVARLALAGCGIRNIQASWVKLGPQRAAGLLAGGQAGGGGRGIQMRGSCFIGALTRCNCCSLPPSLPLPLPLPLPLQLAATTWAAC